jgi:uncharacterized protein DUF2252
MAYLMLCNLLRGDKRLRSRPGTRRLSRSTASHCPNTSGCCSTALTFVTWRSRPSEWVASALWCGVGLFLAADDAPLFLREAKETRASVLEPYVGKSEHENHGQRVVAGQRLMQSASDIFLGWTRGATGATSIFANCVRRRSARSSRTGISICCGHTPRICGWALARAHARSGDAAMISGYMRSSGVFHDAIGEFAVEYADQNQRDYQAFVKAVRAVVEC